MALFVIGYYFYELGTPGGLTPSRLEAAADEQQVTAVERGYNLYQANCAQCHGVDGEGGKGPALNRQDKLFAHLNPELHPDDAHGGRPLRLRQPEQRSCRSGRTRATRPGRSTTSRSRT